jgi:mono/diheme cytochrome c family protein
VDEAAEGAKLFAANCGRCHQPPQDVSPREAKAVLRHMRQRAMLSAEDERLILKFIAP